MKVTVKGVRRWGTGCLNTNDQKFFDLEDAREFAKTLNKNGEIK